MSHQTGSPFTGWDLIAWLIVAGGAIFLWLIYWIDTKWFWPHEDGKPRRVSKEVWSALRQRWLSNLRGGTRPPDGM